MANLLVPIRIAVLLIISHYCQAQTIYYPVLSSDLLKATASDLKSLIGKSMPASQVSLSAYNTIPSSGIVLIYDSTVTGDLSCRVTSVSPGSIHFNAANDNALCFGIYQYLNELGFRFYLPGELWERIPALSSFFLNVNKVYHSDYKYKTWYISGGHPKWIMDNDGSWDWDRYRGSNGHEWSLYQRRNAMTGAYHFNGHRGDILSGDFMEALRNNPCMVACYDSSRSATTQSVPDIFSSEAKSLWANTIAQKYDNYYNIIQSNQSLYCNQVKNWNYFNKHIGIEVPDGARWGNTADGSCFNPGYPSAQDQQFLLSGFVAEKIRLNHPDKRFQIYAYSRHASPPSENILINPAIDIQVIPSAFQLESTTKGLMKRWYSRSSNLSEYHYLNISQWGGETPVTGVRELTEAFTRTRERHTQGIVAESSPSKFASLVLLYAGNNFLETGVSPNLVIDSMCRELFGSAAQPVRELFREWSSDEFVMGGGYIPDNKYKLPHYLRLLRQASSLVNSNDQILQSRLTELKAYLHYMLLYYDWASDQRTPQQKIDKAKALCIYLARINKLKLVNSYFLIQLINNQFEAGSSFRVEYNALNGSAYNGGNLPLITSAMIENNFLQDCSYIETIPQYKIETASEILPSVQEKLANRDSIHLKMEYTYGLDYSNKLEFKCFAASAGSFSMRVTPEFEIPSKSFLRIIFEKQDGLPDMVKEMNPETLAAGSLINFDIPAPGIYKLTIISKNRSSASISIYPGNGRFYKDGPFIGNVTENYRQQLSDFPGYFYVPAAIQTVFFSLNNSNPGGLGFKTAEEVNESIIFVDDEGNKVQARVSANDSALFYLNIPAGHSGKFWRIVRTGSLRLCFSNISNIYWFGQPPACNTRIIADFKMLNGICNISLSSTSSQAGDRWSLVTSSTYQTVKDSSYQLPQGISPSAMVMYRSSAGCEKIFVLHELPGFMNNYQNCSSASVVVNASVVAGPNPVKDQVQFFKEGLHIYPERITITDNLGRTSRKSASGIVSLEGLPAAVYFYHIEFQGTVYSGKLLKLSAY